MVAYTVSERPQKAARRKEVDKLSLNTDDLDGIKLALRSVFEAAVELDSFLAEDKQSDKIVDNDDDSFASEERRLRSSELLLRQALESIDSIVDSKDETDSVSSEAAEPLDDAMCAESYESPESQVPLLQPVSPFGSPISESSRSVTLKDARISTLFVPSTLTTPVAVPSIPTVTSIKSKESKKRQIRAYGLRRHVHDDEKSFVDPESLEQRQSHTKAGDSLHHAMANALFGRAEYTVRPFFSREERTRTVQGTVSVLLALGIVVADQCKGNPHLVLLVFLFPLLLAFIQTKMPHKMDETTLAVVVLGTHVVVSHLNALYAL